MIKYTYENQYELLILHKHVPVFFYLPYFNEIQPISCMGAILSHDMDIEQMVNISNEIQYSGYCTAVIEIICVYFQIQIYNGVPW